MLLYRSRPSDQQGFGDYLMELSKKNGFSDIKRFKAYLANSSRKQYIIGCSYNQLMRIISGLFIELGLDEVVHSEFKRSLCFGCLCGLPKMWNWQLAEESDCKTYFCSRNFVSADGRHRIERINFCGLMRCSVARLGLNFSPEQEGLYFADILSKEERDEAPTPQIYPPHRAFRKG